jgi:hypothetical protein
MSKHLKLTLPLLKDVVPSLANGPYFETNHSQKQKLQFNTYNRDKAIHDHVKSCEICKLYETYN